ncbi:MAG TPA: 2,3-diphosphoglycerate-dependent phosphoglycerate mutase [Candidatus Dormibacteraeota bacterium]|jgi:2,3-bisphosphoglycerate-dependent phosphoglycerate mutase|nr:2,3-diphosphoglycerate-dependent phosphoglycerate mutase [Candidatus Dormibacteraeota bacterium]
MSTLILLRHGESEWNLANRFTGWVDVGLSEKGMEEAKEGGRLMAEAGLRPSVLHTSVLRRAIQTANLALDEMGLGWVPVRRSWRLNERHYGSLQGLNKKETADRYGEDKVKVWRRSYDIPPPALTVDDERHPRFDSRYAGLAPEILPVAESLKDVVARLLPYWYDAVVPDLSAHECVLVAAHGNSLRALVKQLDGLSEADVLELNLPTGVPRVYELTADFTVTSWRYLGNPEEVAERAAAVAAQASVGRQS